MERCQGSLPSLRQSFPAVFRGYLLLSANGHLLSKKLSYTVPVGQTSVCRHLSTCRIFMSLAFPSTNGRPSFTVDDLVLNPV